MHVNKELKKNIILKFGNSLQNTGITEVQVAILTYKINYLKVHFLNHKKDYHGKFGLFRMISKRRRLLSYLKNENLLRYMNLIKKLGLRH
ncbi:MAG: 30S ribosomal subunit protein S15 [Candidatus Westeberhardia cardiocondylae]|nr:30S ribosomal subunit protein S15 [Candidatus Westeberhardia cardiocondylae]